MFIAANAYDGQTINRGEVDGIQFISRQSCEAASEELVAVSKPARRNLFPPYDGSECIAVVLRRENFQAFVIRLVDIGEILACNSISKMSRPQGISSVAYGRKKDLNRGQALLSVD